MKLTPLDIKKQEFKKNLRGYDPIEVDAFLEMVANEFEAIVREKNQMADEILKLKTQLNDYRQVEKALKDTLVTAQENITASRQSSKREADIVLREAEIKAEKIIEGARNKLEKLKSDVLIIKAQKESFARRLRHLLESQIELINVLEMDDSGYDDDSESQKEKRPRMLPDINRQARRKVDIPPLSQEDDFDFDTKSAGRPSNPPKNERPQNQEEQTPTKGGQKKVPRISDQFIT